MKFSLVDRIVELIPGERIRTVKALSLSEEYLADHFPTFPVMPGVLMLECMTQTASWLVRATQNFRYSLYWLAEARNVVYKSFVAPGRVLEVQMTCRALDDETSSFDGRGWCEGIETVKARVHLRHGRLADPAGQRAAVDQELIEQARRQYAVIGGAELAHTAARAGVSPSTGN